MIKTWRAIITLCLLLAGPALLGADSHASFPSPPQAGAGDGRAAAVLADDPSPPAETVKLIFIHHSCGENWLADGNGGLGLALRDNNYFVSDTNYGWGPDGIGDLTDIGHWWTWFRGPDSSTYLDALYAESAQHSSYSRLDDDPGGENQIVMFKSCYPNSNLQGSPGDPVPPIGDNPLRGQGSGSSYHTVANAKGIYIDLLEYFATRQDKLFVVITAPPVQSGTWAANARVFNTWLVEDWLDGYPYDNVAVFDFYNVLTSNGGSWNVNDLGWETGNHHRYYSGAVQYVTDQGINTAAYPNGGSDDHPSPAGNQKGTGEYIDLLNIFYNRWHTPPEPPDNWIYLPLVAKNWFGPASLGLLAVDDFLYQLQNLDLPAIGGTAYDLVVMDYSSDGSAAGEFSLAEIDALKHSSGGDKIVLAYMSIGEAEDYRFYWDESWDADGDGWPDPGAPAWLDVEDPDWEGNYKVRYWDPDWQAIIFAYTGRLLAAGFDGAYLDLVDAYEYYAGQGHPQAAEEMAAFVAAIRSHARAGDPDFYIFPQNAPELAALLPGYLDGVDGIGQEEAYYGYDGDDLPTPPDVTAEVEGYLDLFHNAGKLVLTVDYATTPAHVDDVYARSQARGYVPFCTVRDLDQLIVNPGHEPD